MDKEGKRGSDGGSSRGSLVKKRGGLDDVDMDVDDFPRRKRLMGGGEECAEGSEKCNFENPTVDNEDLKFEHPRTREFSECSCASCSKEATSSRHYVSY